jgi:hypothetical protein
MSHEGGGGSEKCQKVSRIILMASSSIALNLQLYKRNFISHSNNEGF